MILEEKFTIPLLMYLSSSDRFSNHKFLVVGEEYLDALNENKHVTFLRSPLGKNIIINLFIFIKSIYSAKRIITHGSALSIFFVFFPWQIKKLIWPIHGGIDIPKSDKGKTFSEKLLLSVKRRIKYHATGVEEDSQIVNNILNTRSQFIYSPTYLSNVCSNLKEEKEFIYRNKLNRMNLLVGNSTDPSNRHSEIFALIEESQIEFNAIYSILSYGIYEDYKNAIIDEGNNKFKNKFIPITQFMDITEYLKLLDKMDVVIFNHERQEAMGATIQLLSLGKLIFLNSKSPAYQSFKRRGYQVFDNKEIRNLKDSNYLDLRINRELLMNDYSIEQIDNFYSSL
jgi:hypothetical protein